MYPIDDNLDLPEYEQEEPRPEPEELASASELVLSLVRTAKALRIYLPNNPVLIRFGEELAQRMAQHQERYGELRLEVEPFVLRYRGSEVYRNEDPKESLAFRVYSDGIRLLALAPGIPWAELLEFLEVLSREGGEQGDEDIVTRLWERGLPHVSYLEEDDFVSQDQAGLEESEPAPLQPGISALFAAQSQQPPPPVRTIPKQLLLLSAEEAQRLTQAKQADALANPLEELSAILCAILAGVRRDPEEFRDFSRILVKLSCDLVRSGEFPLALRLVRFLDRVAREGGLEPDQREFLADGLAGMLGEGTLEALQKTVDAGEQVSHEELRELLLMLGLPALGGICELLGRVEKLKMRKVIIEVLVELGRERPEVFAPFLSDPRWYLVRNVVLVLSLLETPVALNLIVGLIPHREVRIRKEVLGFLERSPDPKAKSYLLRFLRDEASPLRIRALRILARERIHQALRPILALTSAEEFRGRDFAEKKAVYEALGELGSEQVIPLFREMLLKKHWFKRSQPRENVQLAVAGLLKVKSPSARELLEEARQGSGELKAAIDQALEEIAAGKSAA